MPDQASLSTCSSPWSTPPWPCVGPDNLYVISPGLSSDPLSASQPHRLPPSLLSSLPSSPRLEPGTPALLLLLVLLLPRLHLLPEATPASLLHNQDCWLRSHGQVHDLKPIHVYLLASLFILSHNWRHCHCTVRSYRTFVYKNLGHSVFTKFGPPSTIWVVFSALQKIFNPCKCFKNVKVSVEG